MFSSFSRHPSASSWPQIAAALSGSDSSAGITTSVRQSSGIASSSSFNSRDGFTRRGKQRFATALPAAHAGGRHAGQSQGDPAQAASAANATTERAISAAPVRTPEGSGTIRGSRMSARFIFSSSARRPSSSYSHQHTVPSRPSRRRAASPAARATASSVAFSRRATAETWFRTAARDSSSMRP